MNDDLYTAPFRWDEHYVLDVDGFGICVMDAEFGHLIALLLNKATDKDRAEAKALAAKGGAV